jgi:hypothetical protein
MGPLVHFPTINWFFNTMILDCDGLMTVNPTSIVVLAAAVAKTLIVNPINLLFYDFGLKMDHSKWPL